MNARKIIATSALAVGVLAGSAGIANALSSSGPASQATNPTGTAETETQDPSLNGSIEAPDVEGQSEADESAALESLATVTADEAGQAAVAANPGATVTGVALENENGSVVYEVDMTDASGAAIEVKVDAGNGTVLSQDSGDDEADEGAEDSGDDEADEGAENEADEGAQNEADEATEVAPGN